MPHRSLTLALGISGAAIALLVGALVWLGADSSLHRRPAVILQVNCAAGLKGPVDELAAEYEKQFGTRVIVQYGGSGTLLATVALSKSGDLFIPADESYLALAQAKNLVADSIKLAAMRPVLAVAKGNPKGITGWNDALERPDLRLGLCNPDSAAIGMKIREIAKARGEWEKLESAADVIKLTVSELALDLKSGALDLAFVWDQTAASVEGLEVVPCEELSKSVATVPVIVLTSSKVAGESLRFASWLASEEHGVPVFRRHHFIAPPP